MEKIKQHKLTWFCIIVFGVILLSMPASVYADDGTPLSAPVEDEVNLDEDFYDSDSLGSSTQDFVFTPVKPCRIFDTRKAGGAIVSGGTRSFYVMGANLSGQGGNSAGCVSPVGEPLAVFINIAAVDSTDGGYLTVWPYGTTRPLAAVLNYNPTDITDPISNAFTVKTSGLAGYDINVYAYKETHVVADVMGYYSKPGRTPVDTITVSESGVMQNAGGTRSIFTPACPSGYRLTGGGCRFSHFDASLTLIASMPNALGTNAATKWRCDGRNDNPFSNRTLYVYGICSRIPGR